MKKRLVLFDIDGTLITTNGIARRHFADALDEVFNIPTKARSHDFSGKLDTQIYREILHLAGIPDEVIWERFEAFVDTFYSRLAPDLTPDTVRALPGTKKLLEALQKDSDITLALLTGNLERGARLKLAEVDYNRFFPFGAFGNDGHERQELPAVAVSRAKHFNPYEFNAKEVVIIGDTPNDIHCGAHIGASSIAVATGTYKHDILAECLPDHLFTTLEDTDAVIEAIFHE